MNNFRLLSYSKYQGSSDDVNLIQDIVFEN